MATENKNEKPKGLPFLVTASIKDKLDKEYKIRIASINFNNANFQKDAGYDDKDFERRVGVLQRLVKYLSIQGVVVVNIQEISNRFMNAEKLRFLVLSGISPSWTGTGPIGRHGDHTHCLNLMTLWNADALHLNGLKNFHFSQFKNGKTGDQLATDVGIQATSNALIMDFSMIVPLGVSGGGNRIIEGASVDNDSNLLNVNVHLPIKGPLKVKCLNNLFAYMHNAYSLEEYFVSICGDMNMFADEEESKTMMKQLNEFGTVGAVAIASGGYQYESFSDSSRVRETTFIGMKHDIKNIMKFFDPDAEPDKYAVWCRGRVKEIQDTFARLCFLWTGLSFKSDRGANMSRPRSLMSRI